MAKTNAQRQSEYRERHLKDENGHGDRLNIVLHFHAKRALERLAFCYGVTQQEFLEGLLRQADSDAADAGVEASPMAAPTTTRKQRRLGPEIVTP
jgi:hypothetical protein